MLFSQLLFSTPLLRTCGPPLIENHPRSSLLLLLIASLVSFAPRQTPVLRQNLPCSALLLLCCCSDFGRHPAPRTRRFCPADRVRLRGFSPRPLPAGYRRISVFRGTPENVGWQGLRQASGSIYGGAARRGECCNKSGHGSGRRRGAFVWRHAQKVIAPQRNVCCQAGWGKGGDRERQAACCAEEEDAHHEEIYAGTTTEVAARR